MTKMVFHLESMLIFFFNLSKKKIKKKKRKKERSSQVRVIYTIHKMIHLFKLDFYVVRKYPH